MSSRREYYEAHAVCPCCGHYTWRNNTMQVRFGKYENFKDLNVTKCVCGWEGKVHDLVSRGERKPVVYLVTENYYDETVVLEAYGDRGKAVARTCELQNQDTDNRKRYAWEACEVSE